MKNRGSTQQQKLVFDKIYVGLTCFGVRKRHVTACQNISGNDFINRSFQRNILQKLSKSQQQTK